MDEFFTEEHDSAKQYSIVAIARCAPRSPCAGPARRIPRAGSSQAAVGLWGPAALRRGTRPDYGAHANCARTARQPYGLKGVRAAAGQTPIASAKEELQGVFTAFAEWGATSPHKQGTPPAALLLRSHLP